MGEFTDRCQSCFVITDSAARTFTFRVTSCFKCFSFFRTLHWMNETGQIQDLRKGFEYRSLLGELDNSEAKSACYNVSFSCN